MKVNATRLREIDFLRGIAIILVLFRHYNVNEVLHKAGWVGVDLFFVLSGFLVSGLLFKEYQKYGDIKPIRFLIRRGFKIYPIYYIFYIPYLVRIILNHNLNIKYFLSDMFFVQNYITGWGYAYIASWSLAIEEHFYFLLVVLMAIAVKTGVLDLDKDSRRPGMSIFQTFILTVMFLCLIERLLINFYFPVDDIKNFTMTHLRIDSLLAGVFVSYLYHFRRRVLYIEFSEYQDFLISTAVVSISWIFFVNPLPSSFTKTIGFTLVYYSFSVLLTYFIINKQINEDLNRVFSKPLVNLVSKIGFCSYSIYIIHTFVNMCFATLVARYRIEPIKYIYFLLTSTTSVVVGMIMTYKIEKYFLKLRNKYYPSRVRGSV